MNSAGPMASLGGVEGLAWVNTKYADPSGDYPDIEFHFVSGTPASDSGTVIHLNNGVRPDIWESYYKPVIDKDMSQVIPMLLDRPK